MKNKEELRKYKGSSSTVWGKNEYWKEGVRRNKILEKLWKIKLNLDINKFRRSELLRKYIVKFCLDKMMGN